MIYHLVYHMELRKFSLWASSINEFVIQTLTIDLRDNDAATCHGQAAVISSWSSRRTRNGQRPLLTIHIATDNTAPHKCITYRR